MAQASTPAARTPAGPSSAAAELTGSPAPRKLTLSDAVDIYEQATRAIEEMSARRDEAKRLLLAHAERTGKRTFKDRIAVVQSGGSLILDQAKVRDELGARLPDFQTRTKLGWTLKLLS